MADDFATPYDPQRSAMLQYLISQFGDAGAQYAPLLGQYQQNQYAGMAPLDEDLGTTGATNLVQDYLTMQSDPALAALGGEGAYSATAFDPVRTQRVIDRPGYRQLWTLAQDNASVEGMIARSILAGNSATVAYGQASRFIKEAQEAGDEATPEQQAVLNQLPPGYQDRTTPGEAGPDLRFLMDRAQEMQTLRAQDEIEGMGEDGVERMLQIDPATGMEQLVEITETPSSAAEYFTEQGLSLPTEQYTPQRLLGPEWSAQDEAYAGTRDELQALSRQAGYARGNENTAARRDELDMMGEFATPGGTPPPGQGGGGGGGDGWGNPFHDIGSNAYNWANNAWHWGGNALEGAGQGIENAVEGVRDAAPWLVNSGLNVVGSAMDNPAAMAAITALGGPAVLGGLQLGQTAAEPINAARQAVQGAVTGGVQAGAGGLGSWWNGPWRGQALSGLGQIPGGIQAAGEAVQDAPGVAADSAQLQGPQLWQGIQDVGENMFNWGGGGGITGGVAANVGPPAPAGPSAPANPNAAQVGDRRMFNYIPHVFNGDAWVPEAEYDDSLNAMPGGGPGIQQAVTPTGAPTPQQAASGGGAGPSALNIGAFNNPQFATMLQYLSQGPEAFENYLYNQEHGLAGTNAPTASPTNRRTTGPMWDETSLNNLVNPPRPDQGPQSEQAGRGVNATGRPTSAPQSEQAGRGVNASNAQTMAMIAEIMGISQEATPTSAPQSEQPGRGTNAERPNQGPQSEQPGRGTNAQPAGQGGGGLQAWAERNRNRGVNALGEAENSRQLRFRTERAEKARGKAHALTSKANEGYQQRFRKQVDDIRRLYGADYGRAMAISRMMQEAGIRPLDRELAARAQPLAAMGVRPG